MSANRRAGPMIVFADAVNAALVHTGSAMISSERLSMRFSNVGHSFSHLFMLLYPTALLGLEAELGMSYAELIALLTAGNVLFGLGALPAGWLGDRWDALRMMVLFFVGLGVASILTGLMSSAIGIGSGLALMGTVRFDLPPCRHRLAGTQRAESLVGCSASTASSAAWELPPPA